MCNEEFVLQCYQVSKVFQDAKSELHVLRGVDFQAKAGEQIAIIGRSGTGKTTLLQILGGLDLPTSGEVFMNGVNFQTMSESKRRHMRNRSLGFIYQMHHLLPEFSSLENIAMPMLIADLPINVALENALELL
ncbi:MAG TPA: ATP-binding cassette domain-containing protein, partial [Candidatus Scalindua sp.]|nr:ATP-binding cassette domain-containing protein [Candidatus Scalindua sp.]